MPPKCTHLNGRISTDVTDANGLSVPAEANGDEDGSDETKVPQAKSPKRGRTSAEREALMAKVKVTRKRRRPVRKVK